MKAITKGEFAAWQRTQDGQIETAVRTSAMSSQHHHTTAHPGGTSTSWTFGDYYGGDAAATAWILEQRAVRAGQPAGWREMGWEARDRSGWSPSPHGYPAFA